MSTKRLVGCGVIGGPLFVLVAIVQVFTRRGFDLTHQSLSLLTVGHDGLIQSANFVIAGVLAVSFAVGARRVIGARPGGIWAPRLLLVYGAGLIVGGICHPDAGDGFPSGTPTGQSVVRTWHGVLHMTAGSMAFLALIAACFAFARVYASGGRRDLAVASRVVGGLFALCLVGSGAPGGSLTLFIGASIAMLWMAAVAGRLIVGQPVGRGEPVGRGQPSPAGPGSGPARRARPSPAPFPPDRASALPATGLTANSTARPR